MVRRMKLSFLKKNTSSSSSPSSSLSTSNSSSSSSSSWPWPSSHHQNTKTKSSKGSFTISKSNHIDEPEPSRERFSFTSSFSSASHVMDNLLEPESIENVIRGLKPSKRLTFERRGESNSILEEVTKIEIEEEAHKEEEEEGFMLLSLESNDPYSDFKKSMEKMVEVHELHHDWKSLEKLLFWFLKVNVKTSHRYIYTAFVDLLLNLPSQLSKDVAEETPSSSSPISFNTSCSSSDETSSTSVRFLPEDSVGEKSRNVDCCLSSLFEMEEKINDNNLHYVSS